MPDSAPGQWDAQNHGHAPALRSFDFQPSTQPLSARFHAFQPMTVRAARLFDSRRLEAVAVVAHPEHQPIALRFEVSIYLRAAGVADDVMNAFLEYKENLASRVHAQFDPSRALRSMKIKLDVAGNQNVASELAYMLREITQPVFVRIHRPDDFAHRIH